MLLKVYSPVILCFILLMEFGVLHSHGASIKWEKLKKLAIESDLVVYLEALNRVIDFSNRHKNNIDINLYFGIFLAHVNLKHALQEEHRVLSKVLRSYVEEIIMKTENVLEFFKYMITHGRNLDNEKYESILSLFTNSRIWMKRLPQFHMISLNAPASLSDTKVYTNWNRYRKNIDDRNAWVPNPHQSDLCLASLAGARCTQIGDTIGGTSRRCNLLKLCYTIEQNGTDFGYALAHRLLLLQQARFARGCYIFSEQEDRQLSRSFCSAAYQEAEYIALHEFEIVDLLLEYVCLCALEGYVQFLNRSWLTKILSFQTPYGCFSQNIYKGYKTPCSSSDCNIDKVNNESVFDGYCNEHTTAVAAGTLSLASRFIIQFNY